MRKFILGSLILVGSLAAGAQQYRSPQGGHWNGPPQRGDNTLHVNQSLMRGQAMFSTSGNYKLEFQNDGNLVLTRLRDMRVLWDTGTSRSDASQLIMQDDGNVVLYNRWHRPLWSSGITGPQMRHGQVFVLQDDGNLVVYSRGQVYWASNTQTRSHYR